MRAAFTHNHALAAETARPGLAGQGLGRASQDLYAQVGIGTGSEEFGFVGDHDVWRLPEADDRLNVRPGDSEYYIKYRPVFRAARRAEDQPEPGRAGGRGVRPRRAVVAHAKPRPGAAGGASLFAMAKTRTSASS